MFANLLRKIFGSKNDRELKRMGKLVTQINQFETDLIGLSDDQLRGKTEVFRKSLEDGKTLEQILPEAFAVVREAGKRALQNAPLRCAVDRWCRPI